MISVRVPRFVRLCSGRAREGDLEYWLLRLAALRGHFLNCANVGAGFGPEFVLTDQREEVGADRGDQRGRRACGPFLCDVVEGALPAGRPPIPLGFSAISGGGLG